MLRCKPPPKSPLAEILEGASLLVGIGVCGMIAGWLRVFAMMFKARSSAAQFPDYANSIIDFLVASGLVVPPGLILLLWATILFRRRLPEGTCSPALSLSWWVWGFNLLIGGPAFVISLLRSVFSML